MPVAALACRSKAQRALTSTCVLIDASCPSLIARAAAGEYVRTKAAYTAWQRAGLRPRLPSPLPVAGVRPSSRETPLKERELGWFTEASQASWVVLPVRYFNAAFSAGFVFGVVILSAVICILSPIVGMFVSFFSFGYSLLRSFQRADGRLMTDILGVSELVDQEVAHMKEQMQLAPPVPAAAAGAPIIAAAAGASYGSGGSSTGGAGAIPVPLSHAAFSTRTDMGAAYTMLATGAYGAAVPHALPAGAAAPAQGYMPPAPMPGHGPAHGYESAGGKAVVNPMGAAMASASAASAAASLPTDPTAHSGGFYPQVGGTYH